MDGQITLGEYLEENPLEMMSLEEVAQIIGEALGLSFRWNDNLEHYEAKIPGGIKANISFERWNTGDEKDGRRMIGCGVDMALGGSGCGEDTIEDAIRFLKRGIEHLQEENRRAKAWKGK